MGLRFAFETQSLGDSSCSVHRFISFKMRTVVFKEQQARGWLLEGPVAGAGAKAEGWVMHRSVLGDVRLKCSENIVLDQ